MSLVTISENEVAGGRAIARSYLQQHRVQDATSKGALEAFLTAYQAVLSTVTNHDAAVLVASQEARSKLRVKPTNKHFVYPSAPGTLLEKVDLQPSVLAGYFSFLAQTAEAKVAKAALPQAVCIGARTYVLHKPVVHEELVGLSAEQGAFEKYARQLFLYDPKAMSNPDAGRFPKTVLLVGPPGTGKSSLLKYFVTEAKRLQQVTGTPFTTEVYDASNFSSYFGKSTRILKQKLSSVENPRGVGVFCIEDADMVLQSRNDSQAFHGVLELQQYLMNHLSGLQPYYGNTITVLTTNKPASLDDALFSRMQAVYTINPFAVVATHAQYFSRQFGLAQTDSVHVGSLTHAASLTGRDLESIAFLARQATTRAPTDDELMQKRSGERYASVDVTVLSEIIAGYTAARRTRV